MMANKEDLYRLEKLVNTPGADKDEIRVLRKALWGKSYDRPKQNRYNSTPVRFTFPDGEVKEFSTQREAAEMSGLNKWTLDRACRLQIPLKKGNFAGATSR